MKDERFLHAAIALAAIALALLLILSLVSMMPSKEEAQARNAVLAGEYKPPSVQNAVVSVPLYVLKEMDGGVYIVDAEDGSILGETPIEYESLREFDKALLTDGISAYSYEEICGLTEDFGP